MVEIESTKKIILDSDVIIHFYKGDLLALLKDIFPNELFIVKEVFREVFKGELCTVIENAIKFGFISELDISSDMRVLTEYARLTKVYGPGESACMAYCRFNNDVLASSNLKDIVDYCEENDIQYLTTMDFLNAAYEHDLLSVAECDSFIKKVIEKGSRLPFSNMMDYWESSK